MIEALAQAFIEGLAWLLLGSLILVLLLPVWMALFCLWAVVKALRS